MVRKGQVMETPRANKIIDKLEAEGISQGFSGRPLKRFITRQIKKAIKKMNKKMERNS